MGTVNIRVDDRLIHGQTIVAWCPKYDIKEIIAIDNVSAANPTLKSILTMGVPKGYKTNIVTSEEAVEILKKQSEHNRLVIVKFPEVLKEIEEIINDKTDIILGNIAKRPDSIHKISGATGIYFLSEKDVEDIQGLVNKGIKVTFQQLPSTPSITWDSFLKDK